MVVLNVKNIKRLVLVLVLTASVLASCSKDRLIDIEPYVYPKEYWKKDSLVYTLLLDTTVLNEQVTPYGISSPDTLSLFYETQEYTITFLEESKDSVFVGSTNIGTVSAVDSTFPEIVKYSGNILYVENRGAVTRAADQIEDIKLIIQM